MCKKVSAKISRNGCTSMQSSLGWCYPLFNIGACIGTWAHRIFVLYLLLRTMDFLRDSGGKFPRLGVARFSQPLEKQKLQHSVFWAAMKIPYSHTLLTTLEYCAGGSYGTREKLSLSWPQRRLQTADQEKVNRWPPHQLRKTLKKTWVNGAYSRLTIIRDGSLRY